MKVLITGGTGFIGSHLVAQLHDEGHEPIVFDTHSKRDPYDTPRILGDIRDDVAVTEAVAHVEAVIHLAGVLGTQETIKNPRPAAATNVLGGLNVFEAVAQYQLPAVYIAVGNHWMNNTYSISKTCAERFAYMFNEERGTRIAVVRALNAYGPGQSIAAPYGPSKVRKIMPAFVCRALSNDPIEIYGSGEQIMDMIYVEDVARILIAALETGPHPDGIAYEAGTGRRTTVNDIAGAVIDEVGRGEIVHVPMRPGEPAASEVLGDPGTLAPLGITGDDLVTLEDGLPGTVHHFRQYLAAQRGLLIS